MEKKILLVDDEKIVLKSIAILLEREGYRVVSVTGAGAALALLKDGDFSLLISDIKLPGKNGIELLKEARNLLAKSGKKQIPEILITGYADMAYYQEAVRLGVRAYFHKPFDNKDLIRAVKKAIG